MSAVSLTIRNMKTQETKMWHETNNKLKATFEFKNFTEAFAFMIEVAVQVEKLDHHPEWTNIWNKVAFTLYTHDAGNTVTEKDRELAAAIDKVFTKYS
jgi:4a-hydroxytetrahydrobiopterin dehydratase